jgi:hypothetical protein
MCRTLHKNRPLFRVLNYHVVMAIIVNNIYRLIQSVNEHFIHLSYYFQSLRLVCSSSHKLLILGISVRIIFFNAVVSPCLLHDRI